MVIVIFLLMDRMVGLSGGRSGLQTATAPFNRRLIEAERVLAEIGLDRK
ncbi:MAG: hypothetical protein GY704_16645 [Phycisphaeraceae bacterium]|nr:hypothetical protein [Phycisphaeraceae bacterium]